MKITKISLSFAIIALFSVISFSYVKADVASDTPANITSSNSTELNQDNSPVIPSVSTVSTSTITSSASTDSTQDGTSTVVASSSTSVAQDGASTITSSSSTDLNQDGSAGITSSPSSDLNQDGPSIATSTATTTDTTTPNNGGNGGIGGGSSNSSSGSSSGGNGGGSTSSGGSPLISSLAGITNLDLNTCPLLNSFLQKGGNNDTAQVFKLQAFLKDIENINVGFTGVFDNSTESAVKAFQNKYLTDIMGPWKSNTPSGIVYITTKKKINEIACKTSTLNLSPEELATISTYLANLQNGSTTVPTLENTTGTTTGTTSPLIGGATDNSVNTASVINANILQRFWSFIKNLF